MAILVSLTSNKSMYLTIVAYDKKKRCQVREKRQLIATTIKFTSETTKLGTDPLLLSGSRSRFSSLREARIEFCIVFEGSGLVAMSSTVTTCGKIHR